MLILICTAAALIAIARIVTSDSHPYTESDRLAERQHMRAARRD